MTWIGLISRKDSEGALREAYEKMAARPFPPVYIPKHGDAAGIIRAHSLDAKLMMVVFGGMSSSISLDGPLSWRQRETVNAVTSRANQCFY